MRVALDLDSTLAATSLTAFELMDVDYTYDDIDSWSWGTDKFGTARYLNAMWHSWSIQPNSVPPMEGGLRQTTKDIYEVADQVDIVTAHPDGMMGVDEGKQAWLEDYGIFFDEYISFDGPKEDLDYDVYIDDRPTLVDGVEGTDSMILLRDHPYNRGISLPKEAIRVKSVRDAADWLTRL